MNILGISAFYHDSAAALVQGGDIVAAAQEERFTRKKHDSGFPFRAVESCLKAAGLSIADIEYVAFYEKPFLKFERLLETYLSFAPRGISSFLKAMPVWMKEKLWMKEILARDLGYKGPILFPKHHSSHAASAFYPSPFERAAFLTMDGVGEWTTTSFGTGAGNTIRILSELKFPHSLGLLYSAFTYYTGFKVNSGEYKVMGLAPYGRPRFTNLILSRLVDLKPDGSLRLNMEYFDYCTGLTMTNEKFNTLFAGPPRRPESPVTQKEMDLAASLQSVTEEAVVRMARHVARATGEKNLCLAGGVALNCVANGKIVKEKIFENIWIQPAAGDAGGALGAALYAWYQHLGNTRRLQRPDAQKGSYLGPEFSNADIKKFLSQSGAPAEFLEADSLCRKVADLLATEKVVGWFQGKMEFGPRALGNRSILGDARSVAMQETMNLKIKFRESFRPFAPSVLKEKAREYFDLEVESPYMLLVGGVAPSKRVSPPAEEKQAFGIERLKIKRSEIPAVTHVDYSARVQTVDEKTNPLYHRLLKTFDEKYHCPVLINTSFNVRGEPIVATPEDAYRCFMRTNIDYLVLGNYLLDKSAQPNFRDSVDWQKEFVLD